MFHAIRKFKKVRALLSFPTAQNLKNVQWKMQIYVDPEYLQASDADADEIVTPCVRQHITQKGVAISSTSYSMSKYLELQDTALKAFGMCSTINPQMSPCLDMLDRNILSHSSPNYTAYRKTDSSSQKYVYIQ